MRLENAPSPLKCVYIKFAFNGHTDDGVNHHQTHTTTFVLRWISALNLITKACELKVNLTASSSQDNLLCRSASTKIKITL